MAKVFFRSKGKKRAALFVAAVVLGFVLSEIIIRAAGFDWRLIEKMLGYQNAHLPAHVAVDDPNIFYRLKPGVHKPHHTEVRVNSLRFRDIERQAQKPEGVIRIIAFGGSNVYGLGVEDNETWPAQMNRRLNEMKPGKYEVWNGGVCAYVPTQMAALAKESVELYQPDVVIYGLSNGGGRPFLYEHPVRPYFDKYPSLWEEFFSPKCLKRPGFLKWESRLWLTRNLRLYRLAVAYGNSFDPECHWHGNPAMEKKNYADTQAFLRWAKGKTKVFIFLFPGGAIRINDFDPYFEGTGTPVFLLRADGKPEEYSDIHPPALVMDWYAENIIQWMQSNGFLAPES